MTTPTQDELETALKKFKPDDSYLENLREARRKLMIASIDAKKITEINKIMKGE